MVRKRGFNHLPAVIRALEPAASRLVEKVTIDVAAGAAATAPIDTGTLAESYTGEMVDPLHGQAGTNIEYGPYVEYGTSRGSPAQPHLTPSAERVKRGIAGVAREMGRDIEEAARHG